MAVHFPAEVKAYCSHRPQKPWLLSA